jgi:hypothetical protein
MSFESPWSYIIPVVAVAAAAIIFGVHRIGGGFPFGDENEDRLSTGVNWQVIAVVLGIVILTFLFSGASGAGDWLRFVFGGG